MQSCASLRAETLVNGPCGLLSLTTRISHTVTTALGWRYKVCFVIFTPIWNLVYHLTVVAPQLPPAPQHRGVPSSCLRPVALDLEWMLCVLRYASHNVLHSRWNKVQAQVYCSSTAVNERATKKMIKHFRSINTKDDPNGEAMKSSNYVPRIWLCCVAMSAWIEAGMHHICHEVVARVMLLFEQFSKLKTKTPNLSLLSIPTFWKWPVCVLIDCILSHCPKLCGSPRMSWNGHG